MFDNVLIVCHANVCRSPAAEMLFKAQHARTAAVARNRAAAAAPRTIRFHSAGIRAVNGYGMDPVMQRLLTERGITPDRHQARRLNRQIVRDADLVLVTERSQVQAVEALEPTSRGKVYPLGQWDGQDVADPYGGAETAYRESFALIEHLVMGWLDKLC
ncbi:low molecular weight protein-tyrosine-phosphatase [Paraburkholderia sp. DHOC27]|uniref:low molecular weight protein-tyrosine-phosphatase n=1 Tax=Paraburkholderia sp. DHOC27 TaxID=2303330 RepID=UPI000E3DB609|nr:low molecular weight protein-tyrosine-phosphatase [Paraburkholderia sp. DHOC27]RFU47712.1 low molecular weight phosphotyrosine protein phosphatase [Paraburkholderia sp. DHOC27]